MEKTHEEMILDALKQTIGAAAFADYKSLADDLVTIARKFEAGEYQRSSD